MKAKQMMMGIVAAVAVGAMAEITNTVKVTKFHQSYPYSGKATVEFTVGGTLSANAAAEITINTDDASATFTQNNIVTGANSYVIDFASSFGGALLLTNASFVVTITEGAGDTRSGGTWNDYGNGDGSGYYSGVTWVSSTGQQMSSSPFSSSSCPTYGKDNSALQSAGYIDSTGNLVATHDAAAAHLGAPWRMPTDAEISALINNCTTMWITTNGVPGRLVTGKGAYADRSIFLPAAGYGDASDLSCPGSYGYYWSSTSYSDDSYNAWLLYFDSSNFYRDYYYRCLGRSVRPVRGFAE